MSVFLTPDLQPFLGGTYFPPQDAYGRPGVRFIQRIGDNILFRDDPDANITDVQWSAKLDCAVCMAQILYDDLPGFATVLKRIADVWRSRKNEVIEQSADTMRQLNEAIQPQGWHPPGNCQLSTNAQSSGLILGYCHSCPSPFSCAH